MKRYWKSLLFVAVSIAIVNHVSAQSEVQNTAGGGIFWKTKGNSGTTPTNNFVGTIDAQDLDFRVNSISKMRLFQSSGRLELYGNAADSSTIFIGKNTGSGSTAANGVFIGKDVALNSSGNFNTMIGLRSGRANTTGFENAFLGYQAGLNNTTGRENTFLGSAAGQANTTGNTNVYIGNAAGAANVTGSSNVIIGSDASSSSTAGSSNVYLGNRAGSATTLPSNNTMVGADAGFSTTSGGSNTFIGRTSGFTNTVGTSNTMLGFEADLGVDNLINATAIGARARVDASNSLVLGSINGVNGASANTNVGIGVNAPLRTLHVGGLTNGIRYSGVATGGSFITTTSATTDKILYADANGDIRAMSAGSTGQVLTYTASGPAWSTAVSNDWGILGNASTVDGTNFLGTTDNIPFTVRVNNQRSGRIDHILHNVTWGYRAGTTLSTGTFNTFIGDSAGYTAGSNTKNIAIGASALRDLATLGGGNNNVAIGVNAMRDVSNAERNVAIGNEALRYMFSGYSDNVAIGDSAAHNSRWNGNIAIGSSALLNANTAGNNIAIGTRALYMLTPSSVYTTTSNLAIGNNALYGTRPTTTTNGNNNTVVGNNSMSANTTGYANSIFGFSSSSSNTTGYENVSLGRGSMSANTTGYRNVIVGNDAGNSIVSGNSNTIIGYSANVNLTNLVNATAIGANSRVDASNSMVLGSVNGINGATATTSVGIGVNAPLRTLHIGGLTNGIRYAGVATGGSFITATSATTDKILYADANGDVRAMTAGTTGQVLTYTATGPAWAAAAGGSTGWELTGNTGTNPATNYLGTTDATDLVFRTNATARMRVMGNANQVVINSATPAAASVLSVYSTTTDDAAVLTSSGGGRGLLVSTSLTGIGIGVAKTGTTGRGIELTMAAGTSNEGLFVSHAGSGRAASFNGAGTGQTVFMSNVANNRVLQAQNTNAANTFPVIQASQSSTQTNTNAAAVYATSTSSTGGYFTASKSDNLTVALRGIALSTGAFDPIGVYGEASTTDPGFGYGVVGTGNNIAVQANGDFFASGTKNFVIDHPLYPETKFLKHYSAEANEPLNFYRGNVVADANGEAVVQLPEYFHAVNINFSYVLTPIGAPASVFVKSEVNKSGQFEIAGAKPGMKVSWYIYAQRNDPYVQQHPEKLKAEFDKKPHETGKYYMPELYGQPKEKGIFYRQAPTVNTIEKE